MTDEEIMTLLQSQELSEVETSITAYCGSYVNKDVIDFLVGSLRQEIDNSGLTISYLREGIKSKKELLTIFGIGIIKHHVGKPHKQEYPEGEEPDNPDESPGEPRGMAIGFAYKYLMYLHFLEDNNQNGLLEFIKKERIPYAKDFRETLNIIYKQSIAKPSLMD